MTISYLNKVQEGENIVELVGGSDMPTMLWELLRRATPRGYEHHIRNILPFRHQGKTDEMGNFHIIVGDKNPTTMFSCHMDTVHHFDEQKWPPTGKVPSIRLVGKPNGSDKEKGYCWGASFNTAYDGLKVKNKFNAQTLGADDKAGCYVLCEMIAHNIPGLYVFHVGEERGCVGSRWIVQNTPELVKGIQRCIAFDRKDYTDVIAWQRGSRTASIKCTDAIATQLNELMNIPQQEYKFKGDVRGVFTDSACYENIIPECTNISIGYFDNHGPNEYLDYYWLSKMFTPAAIKVKWNEIPVDRNPQATTVYGYNGAIDYHYGYDPAAYYDQTFDGHSVDTDKTIKGEIRYHTICSTTLATSVPDWQPSDGLIIEASREGMIRIIGKWYGKGTTVGPVVKDAVFNMLLNENMIRLQCKKLTKDVAELKKKLAETEKDLALAKVGQTVDAFLKEKGEKDLIANAPLPLLAFDKDGFPLNEELRIERASMKIGLINQMLIAVAGLSFSNKYKQAISHIEEHKVQLAAWVDTDPANKKLYEKLNVTLSNLYNIVEIEAMTNKPSDRLTELYLRTQNHFKECYIEAGINAKNIAATA